MRVPRNRIRELNDASIRADADYVLYWMIGARRTGWNFALDHALEWSVALDKPLLVFEPLRVDYEWASARFQQFIIEGMRDNAATCAAAGVTYYPYVEPASGAARGLLEMLAGRAAIVITDDTPAFFTRRMVEAAALRVAPLVAVDGHGLLPVDAVGVAYNSAYAFRRLLQAELPAQLRFQPRAHPFADYAQGSAPIAADILMRWPKANVSAATLVQALPLDQNIAPVSALPGGSTAGAARLGRFIAEGLPAYHVGHNGFEPFASSGLSPYLHFGHSSAHCILDAVANDQDWRPDQLAHNTLGRKEGWWGMSSSAEAFLDELVTWRELAANGARHLDDFEHFDALPDWAHATLQRHIDDPRPALYDIDQFRAAETHDAVWNAAQRQLVRDGTMHRYLRMLWGKKIIEWTEFPELAWEIMVELNNRYALDGRDANSWAGIAWVFGRYDRPWPERAVYGTVRCMTSQSAARKFNLTDYLETYA